MAPKKVGAAGLLAGLTDTWYSEGSCLKLVRSGGKSQKEVTDLFYPTRESTPADFRQAKDICAACPVKMECLDFAIRSVQTQGIWGGTTQQERRVIWKKLRKAS